MASRAVLFLMVGLPGAGKTTVARSLEAEHHALRLTPDEWMIPLFGESDAGGKRDVLEGRLIWLALRAVQVGASVILDFGLWGREERTALRWLTVAVGAECQVAYLPIDEATQRERIGERFLRTPEQTFEITASELAAWQAQFQEPDDTELGGTGPDGTRLDAPPTEYATWSQWASERWPSLPTLDELVDSRIIEGGAP